MTYLNAIKYIKKAPNISPQKAVARERIKRLFKVLGDPQKKIKYIRLAGSNGKSVCSQMMTSILNSAKILSGCVTMQILSDFAENVRIAGNPLTMNEITSYIEQIIKAVSTINQEDKDNPQKSGTIFAPTAHEIILCMAMLAFSQKKCEIVFIESDHSIEDPSRFLDVPLSTIICGAIPSDKKELKKINSYIQKGLTEIVSVPQNTAAYHTISKTCQETGCRLTMSVSTKAKILYSNLRGTKFEYLNQSYTLKICGKFQVTNALLAIESARMLNRHHYSITDKNIIDGLAKTTLPAKFEVISVQPTIIVDSTHTPVAIEMVSDSLVELKDLTGTNIRLCLTDEELCDYYTDALSRRGYNIESIIALSPNKDYPISQAEGVVLLRKTPELAAKAALAGLNNDLILLISGRSDIAEEIRAQIHNMLSFH